MKSSTKFYAYKNIYKLIKIKLLVYYDYSQLFSVAKTTNSNNLRYLFCNKNLYITHRFEVRHKSCGKFTIDFYKYYKYFLRNKDPPDFWIRNPG